MKLPFFVFNGHKSLDYGLYVQKKNTYKGAKRDITVTSIPGRSGDLITDNGRYHNATITYQLALINDTPWRFEELAQLIRAWLLPKQGYIELWDTYDGAYYRLGAYTDEVNIAQELQDTGTVTLAFNCKPFKYSFDGQRDITMSSAGRLYNAEAYPSKPYIKIIGDGSISLTVGGESFLFSNVDGYIEIDSEQMNAYKGNTAQNNKMSAGGFPVLVPGMNLIAWTGNVSHLEIVPRWCSL